MLPFPQAALQWGSRAPELVQGATYRAGRPSRCPTDGDPLLCPESPPLCPSCRDPGPRGSVGGGCPQSLLLSLVLKHLEQAGPGLFAGPVGAAGETGWHPARPAPLHVPTALCAAAHAVLAVWQGGPLPPAHPPR